MQIDECIISCSAKERDYCPIDTKHSIGIPSVVAKWCLVQVKKTVVEEGQASEDFGLYDVHIYNRQTVNCCFPSEP